MTANALVQHYESRWRKGWPLCTLVWLPGVRMKILRDFYHKTGFGRDWKLVEEGFYAEKKVS